MAPRRDPARRSHDDGPDAGALLARYAAAGDPADLAALFDLAAPDLFRLALHLCPNAADAEDALQETFLAVMEHAGEYDPARPALPWLAGVLRHRCGSARRSARRGPDPRRLDPPREPDDPALLAASAEEAAALHEAIRRLPEPYRGVALLRWRYGHDPAEIADIRGVPPGTVWSLLHRAVQRLRVGMGSMPALLHAFREERGLEGVRAALVRRAATRAAAAAVAAAATASAAYVAAASATGTTGGVLVANKAAVAAVAVVLLGAAGWLAFRPAPEPGAGGTAKAPPIPPPAVPALPPPAETAAAPVAPAAPALPDPVDLSRCDRHLDLFGTVVDEADAPVAGAEVAVRTRRWRDVMLLDRAAAMESGPGPATRSARDGTFVLRLDRGDHVDLVGRAEGFAETVRTWCLAGERVRLVLRRGATLVVEAKDEEGKPVEGVAVSVHRWEQPRSMQPSWSATTGKDGRTSLAALLPGEVIVLAEHPRYGVGRASPVTVPESGSLTVPLVLPAGRTVRGRVTSAATGEPLAGATVGENWMMYRAVRSDAEGRYEIHGVPTQPNRGPLYAEAAGHARVRVAPYEGDTCDIALPRADAATGRVVSARGEPVAGAEVAALGVTDEGPASKGTDARHARSGADGRFRIEGLRPDIPHTLAVEAPGHGRVLRDFAPSGAAGGVVELGDVAMAEARALEGVVLGANDAPCPGMVVVLRGPGGRFAADIYLRRGASRRTDDLGRFRFHDLAPGSYEVALANIPGQTPASLEVVVAEGRDVLDAVLRVPEGAELRVAVVDPSGAPLEGIAINARAGAAARSARTDAAGRAAFPGLPKQEVRVTAWDTAQPPRWIADDPSGIAVPAGTAEARVVLRDIAWIHGRVTGPDGAGLPGLQVVLRPEGAASGNVYTTGADGGFAASGAKGARYHLEMEGWKSATGPGRFMERTPYRAEPVAVVAPVEGIEIRAAAVASDRTLTVRVVDLDGKGIPAMCLTLLRPGADTYPVTGADGEVVLEGLLAEPIQFGVFPAGAHGPASTMPEGCVPPARVTVVPEGQTLTLAVRKGVPLGGLVLDAEGRPVEGASVVLQTRDYASSFATTDAAGRFRAFVAPGQTLLMAHAQKSVPGNPPTQLVRSLGGADLENPELEFRLEPQLPR